MYRRLVALLLLPTVLPLQAARLGHCLSHDLPLHIHTSPADHDGESDGHGHGGETVLIAVEAVLPRAATVETTADDSLVCPPLPDGLGAWWALAPAVPRAWLHPPGLPPPDTPLYLRHVALLL